MIVSIFTIQNISTIEIRINKAYAAVSYNWKNRKPGFPFIGLIKAIIKISKNFINEVPTSQTSKVTEKGSL